MTILSQNQKDKAASLREFLRERAADGKVFSVVFTKRTTGEVRHMVCRLGVTSHLKGGTKSFDDAEHSLLTVYDMTKKGYRSISLESVTDIKLAGDEWHELDS